LPAWGGLLLFDYGISYVAVLLALVAMRLKPKPIASETSFTLATILQHLKEGFAYAFGYAPARSILIMVGLVSFLGVNFVVVLPIFSTKSCRETQTHSAY
jgi:uncharacterized membrane protein YgaE (UPF0421/DUF939 family)